MTSPIVLADDDEFTSWDTEPSPAHPHVALLLGGSLLAVILVCVLPLFVVDTVRHGMAEIVLGAMALIGGVCGAGPFLSSRLQSLRYAMCALLVFDALPLVVVTSVTATTPARQWSSLMLIPVLLTAATMNRRFYQVQLAAGCCVGLTIMIIDAPSFKEAVLTCIGYVFFMLVCARLTRQDWAALHRQFEALKRRSHTDELTGLLNRRGFVAQFPDLRRRAIAEASPLGMVMIDIDHFSRINALHGHAFGDTVLQQVCALVLRQPGVSDGLVARIGGEELVVVTARPAEPIAASIWEAVRAATIHPGLTVSMGISDSDPAHCVGAEALWRLVNVTDTAMYQAKESGRDRIVRAREDQPDRGVALDADGWPLPRTDVEPSARAGSRSSGLAATGVPASRTPSNPGGDSPAPTTPADVPLDYRLFGIFCLVFAGIGTLAYVLRVAVDRQSIWAPVYLALLVLVGGFALYAIQQGRRLGSLPSLLTYLAFEACTISAVLAADALEHRLMIICVIAVPVLIAAHSAPRGFLVSQYALVFVGAGLAARPPGTAGLDASWFHRSLCIAVVLSTAPAVLFWLRERRGAANARLRLLTAIDPLTGVRNRSGLDQAAVLGDPDEVLHILSVNIDRFKVVNDTHGHVYGDRALALLADTLARTVRDHHPAAHRPGPRPGVKPGPQLEKAIVARTGGDRFVVVSASPVDPLLIRRLKRAVAAMPVELSVSYGESEGPSTSSVELWALVAEADADLARSKLQR